MVARLIHDMGNRCDGPFVQLNCGAATNPHLIGSELFGHVRGAFTGAFDDREGKFEQAAGGTLFLDEVGELPLELQSHLLKVIDEGWFEKIGGLLQVATDVRVILATNRDIVQDVQDGLFREDLFYRIGFNRITVPSLRDHREDIPLLASHCARQWAGHASEHGHAISAPEFTDAALEQLMAYDWPGNVRELNDYLLATFVRNQDCTQVDIGHLAPRTTVYGPQRRADVHESCDFSITLPEQVGRLERSLIICALTEAYGNQSEAARLLGVGRVTLGNKIKKYGVDPSEYR